MTTNFDNLSMKMTYYTSHCFDFKYHGDIKWSVRVKEVVQITLLHNSVVQMGIFWNGPLRNRYFNALTVRKWGKYYWLILWTTDKTKAFSNNERKSIAISRNPKVWKKNTFVNTFSKTLCHEDLKTLYHYSIEYEINQLHYKLNMRI